MTRRIPTENLTRALAGFAFATGAAWTLWHIVKGRAGAQPVMTAVLIVIELMALLRLVGFVIRSGSFPAAPLDAVDDDASGTVVVLAEAHDLRTLRAAVLAARLAWNSAGIIICKAYCAGPKRGSRQGRCWQGFGLACQICAFRRQAYF